VTAGVLVAHTNATDPISAGVACGSQCRPCLQIIFIAGRRSSLRDVDWRPASRPKVGFRGSRLALSISRQRLSQSCQKISALHGAIPLLRQCH
jgi:hypothetical protein